MEECFLGVRKKNKMWKFEML